MSAPVQPVVMTREMAVRMLDSVVGEHHAAVMSAILSARFDAEIECVGVSFVGDDGFVEVELWDASIAPDVGEFVMSFKCPEGCSWAKSCRVILKDVVWQSNSSS